MNPFLFICVIVLMVLGAAAILWGAYVAFSAWLEFQDRGGPL